MWRPAVMTIGVVQSSKKSKKIISIVHIHNMVCRHIKI